MRAILQRRRRNRPLVERVEPALRAAARQWVWRTNPAPPGSPDPLLLHLGCGDRVLPGFVNVDFLPGAPDVLAWNLLDRWPDSLAGRADAVFSEDVVEHFFFDEQVQLLAEGNRALAPGGIFRVLMPDLAGLLEVGRRYDPESRPKGFLSRWFGVDSGADVINLGLRFGGHRWLHDQQSFAMLAALCGFSAERTRCAESSEPRLSGCNLRDETNSLSFAFDLRKRESLERLVIEPERVVGAASEGELAPGQPLYRSTSTDPQVYYRLPAPLPLSRVVVIVIRGANLSQQAEHNYAELHCGGGTEETVPIDASMASIASARCVAAPLLGARVAERELDVLRFDPARAVGDWFSVGPLEIHLAESDWRARVRDARRIGGG